MTSKKKPNVISVMESLNDDDGLMTALANPAAAPIQAGIFYS